MDIRQAVVDDLELVAPLFDAYRQFYKQPPDIEKARNYLRARLSSGEADVFLCMLDGAASGFTLLYPTFCSVTAAPVFVLYDLFVSETARRQGVGKALLDTAQSHAKQRGAAWLKLETAIHNSPAQSLYEKAGWKRDTEFYTYHFAPPK